MKKKFIRHAKKRARERFGLGWSPEAVRQVIRQIQEGQARFLRRTSNSRTVFEVQYQGELLPVVYSSANKTIVTVLPAAALNEYQPKKEEE